MNIVEALATWLQDIQHLAVLRTDMFISRAPSRESIPSRIFWLKASGGVDISTTLGGSVERQYIIDVNMRSTSATDVYDTLQSLSVALTMVGCEIELPGFDVTEITTQGPFTDDDLDLEERSKGLLQVTISAYTI